MYTDKRKIFYGIILFIVALSCIGCLIVGKSGASYYIGAALGIFFGISFIRSAKHR